MCPDASSASRPVLHSTSHLDAHSESRKAGTPQGTKDTLKAVQGRQNIRAYCTESIGPRTHQVHQINNRTGTVLILAPLSTAVHRDATKSITRDAEDALLESSATTSSDSAAVMLRICEPLQRAAHSSTSTQSSSCRYSACKRSLVSIIQEVWPVPRWCSEVTCIVIRWNVCAT